MRVLFGAGGTAGHINPALAIAQIIKANCPTAKIAFVGTPAGMESRLVAEAGFPMYPIEVAGLSRSLSPRNLRALYLAAAALPRARRILDEFRPDLVIGTGGYVCWPILREAARAGIATALHESNAQAGLATRRLARHIDELWLNFAATADRLPKGSAPACVTGNPTRRGFGTLTRETARRRLGLGEGNRLVLSFGGSRGAEHLNEAILPVMRELCARYPGLYHVHACGTAHYAALAAKEGGLGPRARLVPYLSEMPLYMAAADLVICRAGAMTLSELAICGRAAILVPSPYVAANHQYENAAVLVRAGAACLCEEHELGDGRLLTLCRELLDDEVRRRALEVGIRAFAVPDANRRIWARIDLLSKKAAKTVSAKEKM